MLSYSHWLGLILVGHMLIAVVYSAIIPPWEAHDEWAHYRYAAYIAENLALPDPNTRLTTEFTFDEASQPPLYYMLAATPMLPVETADGYRPLINPYATRGTGEGGVNFVLHDPDVEGWPWRGTILALHLGRLVSVLISTAGLYLTYRLARLLSPAAPTVALTAVGIQAFAPQYVFLSAVMTNDILLVLVETAFLYLCIRLALEGPVPRRVLLLAFIAGLALLTKYLALAILPLALVALLLGAWRRRHETGRRRQSAHSVILLLVVTLAMGGAFLGRNLLLTGALIPRDPTSQEAVLSGFLNGQSLNLDVATVPSALIYGFETFWVSFGWGNVGAPDWIYWIWFGLLALGALGILIWISKEMPAHLRPALLIVALFVVAVITLPLLRELIHQSSFLRGRYILATLPVAAWVIAQGWAQLSGRAWAWLRPALVLWPALLSLALIPMIILPSYTIATSETAPASATAENVGARFGEVARLIAVDLGDIDEVFVGRGVPVTLTWQALAHTETPYTLSIHVLGAGNESYGSVTSYPGHGNAATTVWQPGDIFTETYWVRVEEKGPIPALGRVAITLSSKDADPTYLPLYDAEDHHVGNTLRVGHFRIDDPQAQATRNSGFQTDDYLARFDDFLLLTDVQLPHTVQQPGWSVPVVTRWRALGPADDDLKLTLQLLNTDGEWVTGVDGNPSESLPPNLWRQGDYLHATRWLDLPEDLPAGDYTVIAAFYWYQNLTRVPASDNLGQPLAADAWPLGVITVVSPDAFN